jgi:hypothetical protein
MSWRDASVSRSGLALVAARPSDIRDIGRDHSARLGPSPAGVATAAREP